MPRYPFTPSILDALPEELAELFRGLELTLLDEICSRLKKADGLNAVTVQDIRALRSHGIDLDEIKKAIAETSETSMEKLDSLFDDVVERNKKYYTEMIDLAQVTEPETLVDEQDIEAIRMQTKGELKNFTQSMGFVVQRGNTRVLLKPAQTYQSVLDAAELKVMSGAISYNEAISDAVQELADSGLCVAYNKKGELVQNVVKYESGHIDQLDVAARRAIMTGVNQTNQKYREQAMDYLKTDLVETSAHLGARNTGKGFVNHESWQGKIFRWSIKPRTSKKYYPDFDESCAPGNVQGIGGANCRHTYSPFLEGIMEPAYSKEDLGSMKADNHKFVFDGKEYNGYSSTQMQRKIERSIRKQKRLKTSYEAAGLNDKATASGARIRALNKKYREFSAAAGLPEQRDRIKVLYT